MSAVNKVFNVTVDKVSTDPDGKAKFGIADLSVNSVGNKTRKIKCELSPLAKHIIVNKGNLKDVPLIGTTFSSTITSKDVMENPFKIVAFYNAKHKLLNYRLEMVWEGKRELIKQAVCGISNSYYKFFNLSPIYYRRYVEVNLDEK